MKSGFTDMSHGPTKSECSLGFLDSEFRAGKRSNSISFSFHDHIVQHHKSAHNHESLRRSHLHVPSKYFQSHSQDALTKLKLVVNGKADS